MAVRFAVGLAIFAVVLFLTLDARAENSLRIAVASTVENSGLARLLAASFERSCDCRLDLVAAGSSRALALAARGDVQAAITHAPELERELVAAGGRQVSFMANEFILVGPPDDPARTQGMGLVEAFQAVAASEALFVTRADRSGTNLAELALWRAATGAVPEPSGWYREAGAQMAAALQIADQLGAYSLSDSATYASLRASGALALAPLAADSPPRRNVYSLVTTGGANELADELAAWLTGDEVRAVLAGHQVAGAPLFTPYP